MSSVNWGKGLLKYGRAKTRSNEQLTNQERKKQGLPHDGAKQHEKDRRRRLCNEGYFESGVQRACAIVTCAGDF